MERAGYEREGPSKCPSPSNTVAEDLRLDEARDDPSEQAQSQQSQGDDVLLLDLASNQADIAPDNSAKKTSGTKSKKARKLASIKQHIYPADSSQESRDQQGRPKPSIKATPQEKDEGSVRSAAIKPNPQVARKKSEPSGKAHMRTPHGSSDPLAGQLQNAVERVSGHRPASSESVSSISGATRLVNKRDSTHESNRTYVTSIGTNETRLRVDATVPLQLSFNGDMEGRTLHFAPAEDGMANIIIGGSRGEERQYQSERGRVLGKNNKQVDPIDQRSQRSEPWNFSPKPPVPLTTRSSTGKPTTLGRRPQISHSNKASPPLVLSQTPRRPSSQRRPTMIIDHRDRAMHDYCIDPSCTKCGPSALPRRRPQGRNSAVYYVSPPVPTLQTPRNAYSYLRGPAVVQPAKTLSRRRSFSPPSRRRPSVSNVSYDSGYPYPEMPAPPQYVPPPSSSASVRPPHKPEYGPPVPISYGPPVPISYGPPVPSSYGPPIPTSGYYTFGGPPYGPPISLSASHNLPRPTYSARYSTPSSVVTQESPFSQLEDTSSASSSSEDEEEENGPNFRRARNLIPGPTHERRNSVSYPVQPARRVVVENSRRNRRPMVPEYHTTYEQYTQAKALEERLYQATKVREEMEARVLKQTQLQAKKARQTRKQSYYSSDTESDLDGLQDHLVTAHRSSTEQGKSNPAIVHESKGNDFEFENEHSIKVSASIQSKTRSGEDVCKPLEIDDGDDTDERCNPLPELPEVGIRSSTSDHVLYNSLKGQPRLEPARQLRDDFESVVEGLAQRTFELRSQHFDQIHEESVSAKQQPEYLKPAPAAPEGVNKHASIVQVEPQKPYKSASNVVTAQQAMLPESIEHACTEAKAIEATFRARERLSQLPDSTSIKESHIATKVQEAASFLNSVQGTTWLQEQFHSVISSRNTVPDLHSPNDPREPDVSNMIHDEDDNMSVISSYAASIASIFTAESLASSASNLSKASGYSAVQIATATKQLLSIFLDDNVLLSLYKRAIENTDIGPERLQRNLRRMFRTYADHLGTEATDRLEYLAARLVTLKARYLAQVITDRLRQRGPASPSGALNDPLEDSSADEDDVRPVDEDAFEDFAGLRDFLVGSEAFSVLRTQLQAFVLPKVHDLPKKDSSDTVQPTNEANSSCGFSGQDTTELRCNQITWSEWVEDAKQIANGIFRHQDSHLLAKTAVFLATDAVFLMTDYLMITTGQLESPLKRNMVRLRWQSTRGDHFYSDVTELRKGGVAELVAQMRRTSGTKVCATPYSSNSGNQQYVVPRPGHWLCNAMAKVVPSFGRSSKPVPCLPQHNSAAATNACPVSPNSSSQQSMLHLLACMHRNRIRKVLQQDRIEKVDTDWTLLCFMRHQYLRHRGRFLRTLSLKSVKGISFVKFRLPIGGSVDVRHHNPCCVTPTACECIPPITKVEPSPTAEYRCIPGPPATYPPIPPEYLSMLFSCPGNAGKEDTWILDQLPKRTCGELQGRVGQPAEGWGIYYQEGWDRDLITLAIFIVFMLASLLFGVLWTRFRFDIQGAFGVSSYLVALSSILIILVATRAE